LRIRIITVVITTLSAISTSAVAVLSIGSSTITLRSRWAILILAVNSLLQICDPAIDLALRLEEAFAQILSNDWKVIINKAALLVSFIWLETGLLATSWHATSVGITRLIGPSTTVMLSELTCVLFICLQL
jgi:hypothetical protein